MAVKNHVKIENEDIYLEKFEIDKFVATALNKSHLIYASKNSGKILSKKKVRTSFTCCF